MIKGHIVKNLERKEEMRLSLALFLTIKKRGEEEESAQAR
jgi:hypothetical protein